MDENDRLQMYEAQAIALEKEEELEQRTRELERKEKELKEAQREIERLRITNQQLSFRDAVAEMEQTFNAKFLEMNQKFELQISKLQREIDEKTKKNVGMKEYNKTIARINKALAAKSELKTKDLFMKISNRLDVICSELNPHTSVILLGGWHSNITDSVCMFNSKENKWINSQLKLPDKLCQHGSVILNDEIYIFGGWNENGYLKSTYKLRENGEWIQLADMNEMRNHIERSSVVFEDEIWVFGGGDNAYSLRTVEKYNKQRNIWIKMPEMNEARNSTSVSIINGKFYVFGGFAGKPLETIEVYDPEKEKWEIFCNLPLALYDHTSIVDGTNLIIIGGNKSDNKPSAEVWKIDVMDPKKEWKRMPNLQQPRYNHGAVKLEDGLMVIGGSIDGTTRINLVKIFDGQKWKEGPKLPEIRCAFSFIPLTSKNEKIFLRRLCK